MDNRSLASEITLALREAKELHHIAVGLGDEIDENWPVFYGKYLAGKLRPMLTVVQADNPVMARVQAKFVEPVCPVPQADGDGTTDIHWEIDGDTGISYPVQGRDISSRYHVGE